MIQIPQSMATINAPMTRDVLSESGVGTLTNQRQNNLPWRPIGLRKVNPSFDAARRTGPPIEVRHSLVTKGGLPVHVRSANSAPSQVGFKSGPEWGIRGMGDAVQPQQSAWSFFTGPGGVMALLGVMAVVGTAVVLWKDRK